MTSRTVLLSVGHGVRSEVQMDTYTAIPDITRMPIKVLDLERYDEWLESPDLDAPVPMITRIFVVYGKGPGTPVPIQMEVDQIEAEYSNNIPTDEDRESMSANEYLNKWRRVNMLLRRNLLLAVIRGLDQESANVLAAEDENGNGEGRRILEQRGWIESREELRKRLEEVNIETEDGESESPNDETGQQT